jgi:hypothetical protein
MDPEFLMARRPSPLRRFAAGMLALMALAGASESFSAAEWQVLTQETPRLAAAWGAAAGRAAACHERLKAEPKQQFDDFLLRYLAADAASRQLEIFDNAADAARRKGCDRYQQSRDWYLARQARARIEPVLRDHHF